MKPVLESWLSHFLVLKLRYIRFVCCISPIRRFGCYSIFSLRPHLIYSNWNVHYMSISLNLQDFKSLSKNTMSFQFCLVILQDSWDAIKGVRYETRISFALLEESEKHLQEEHIPVGCIPSATVAVFGGGFCLGGVCQGGCLTGGCLPRGVSAQGGACPGGVSAQGVSA